MESINLELLQIIFVVGVLPGGLAIALLIWVTCRLWGQKGKIYSAHKDTLYILGLHPKDVPFCEIQEAGIYHSWWEPIHRGQWWTVRIKRADGKSIRFLLGSADDPGRGPDGIREVVFGWSSLSGADRARDRLIQIFKEHGIKCRWGSKAYALNKKDGWKWLWR